MEDILRRFVETYLQLKGFFTAHDVRFQPVITDTGYIPKHANASSLIDVIGLHPMRDGFDRVWVVSCTAWLKGFDPQERISAIEKYKFTRGVVAWRDFRELAKRMWADGLIAEVQSRTGSSEFTYVTAVTKLCGDATIWEQHSSFRENLRGNPIKILTVDEMFTELGNKTNTRAVPSDEFTRILQVIKASDWKP